MPLPHIKLGKQSGEHGSYTFYRSFSYLSGGKWRNVQLGKFFFLKLDDDSPICIGELQLVWTGRYSNHPLTSIRLYYLPEQLPDGRQSHHGQDEVVATDKMVIHVKDLITWIIHEGVEWSLGLSLKGAASAASTSATCRCSKKNADGLACNVQIIDFTKYCRLRTALKRTGGRMYEEMANHPELSAIYGLSNIKSPDNYIMFCKETFESPELENHDFRCDHLAPNLKGRPRKKGKGKHIRVKRKSRRGRVAAGGGSGVSISSASTETLKPADTEETDKIKETEKHEKMLKQVLASKECFTKSLYKHMKEQGTPILKIPSLGFKKVDLFMFFKHAYSVGGYREICRRRLWKNIYDRLGGSPHNTSAASCAKRQYERLLLSFEKYMLRSNSLVRPGIKLPSSMQQKKLPLLRTAVQLRDRYTEIRRCEIWRDKPLGVLPADQRVSKQKAVKLLQADADDDVPLSMLAPAKSTIALKAAATTVVTPSSSDSLVPAVIDTAPSSTVVNSTVATGTVWNVPSSISTPACSSTTTRLTDSDSDLLKSRQSQPTCVSLSQITSKPPKASQSTSGSTPVTAASISTNLHLSGGILPAHCFLKAPLPLHVLGPCFPYQLTAAQKCPWTKQLNTEYPRPICAGGMINGHKISDLKRALPEDPLDLSAKRQKLIPKAHGEPQLIADDCGALDLTISRDKPLALVKVKSESDGSNKLSQDWKTQDEPLNYSKGKISNFNFNPQNQPPPPLVHRDLVVLTNRNIGSSYFASSSDVSHSPQNNPKSASTGTKILQPSPQYPAHMNPKLAPTNAQHQHAIEKESFGLSHQLLDKGRFDYRNNMLPAHQHVTAETLSAKKITTAHQHTPPDKFTSSQYRLATSYEHFRTAEILATSAVHHPSTQNMPKSARGQEAERVSIQQTHQAVEDVATVSPNPAAERLMTAAHHLAAVSYNSALSNRLSAQSGNLFDYYHPKSIYGAQYPDRGRRSEPNALSGTKKLEIDLTRDEGVSSSNSAGRTTSQLLPAHMGQTNSGKSKEGCPRSHMSDLTRRHSPNHTMTSPRLHTSNHAMNSPLLHSPSSRSIASPRLQSPNHTMTSPRLHSSSHTVNRSRHLPSDQPLMRGPPPRYNDYHRRIESSYITPSSQHSNPKPASTSMKLAESKYKPQPSHQMPFPYQDTSPGSKQHSQRQERGGLPSPQLVPHLHYPGLANHQAMITSRHPRMTTLNPAIPHIQPSLQRLPTRIDPRTAATVRYGQLPAPPRLQPIPSHRHGSHQRQVNP